MSEEVDSKQTLIAAVVVSGTFCEGKKQQQKIYCEAINYSATNT